MDKHELEEAILNTWPALQQVLLDGWVLRFSKGYTKRANSVNPLYESVLDPVEKIAVCEELYVSNSLSPLFRLTPFTTPPGLDALLEERHYRKVDPIHVLYLDLTQTSYQAGTSLPLMNERIDNWFKLFCAFNKISAADHQLHKTIVGNMVTPPFLATLSTTEQVAACGLASLHNGYLALADIVTNPAYRQQGMGQQLVNDLLAWGQARGARHAFIQVSVENTPMQRLAGGLGFRQAYQYWYRKPPRGAMGVIRGVERARHTVASRRRKNQKQTKENS